MIPLNEPQYLSPRAQVLWIVKGAYFVIFAVVLFVIATTGILGQLESSGIIGFIVALGALLINIFIARLAHSRFRYTLKDSGIQIESGIVFKRILFIPYATIQRTEVFQDILERLLGICDIILEVAAPIGSATDFSDTVIPSAERRGTVTRLPGVAKDEVDQIIRSITEYTNRCRV